MCFDSDILSLVQHRRKEAPGIFEGKIYFFFNFYLFMIVTERERHRDTGRGRSRLHAPGARRGIRSRVSRIVPWAKGRGQTAAPPRDPYNDDLKNKCKS